jgi:hypothetical protein
MLSLHQLVENGDLTFCLDNEALYVKSLADMGIMLTTPFTKRQVRYQYPRAQDQESRVRASEQRMLQEIQLI